MKKILVILLLLVSVFCPRANASGEFSSSYDINYSVLEDTTTEVSEKIKLKNLTEKFFPSSFSLTLPGNEISDIEASDAQGSLNIETKGENSGTKLTVKFTNQQIIGLGKEYNFTLRFKDKGLSKKLGKVWSIKIPKISQQGEVEDFNLTLSVPTSFGDPDYIVPKPSEIKESAGRISFLYSGRALFQSGVSAIFGQDLNYSFETFSTLKNNSIFPKFLAVPIAFNSSFQKTFIENIDPRPENVKIDKWGNSLAFFKLNPGKKQDVKVSGFAKIFLNSFEKDVLSNEQTQFYLRENEYASKNSPVIQGKLSEILEGKKNFSPLQKAQEIDKFVSNFLRFDYSRVEKGDFARLGSLTAINNPEKALSSEFVDLEVALFRSAGIPVRQVAGFSLPQDRRPHSYKNKYLHTWVEFYDSKLGWVTSDPTWENTTGGTVLLNFNDLNHIYLTNLSSGNNFNLPDKVEAKIVENEIEEKKGAELDIEINPEILSGFPSKAKIKITNLGNANFPHSELKIDTSKILMEGNGGGPSLGILLKTPKIPPFGKIEYDLSLKTGAVWNSYQDVFQVNFAGVTDTRVVTVKPLLSYKIFSIEIFGGLTIIALFYLLTILVHRRSSKNS